MIIRVKNHHMPPMIRVDRALGISSEPGVGVGERGQREQRERTWVIHTDDHYIRTCTRKGLGLTVRTVTGTKLKPTGFEASYPDILHTRKSVGFVQHLQKTPLPLSLTLGTAPNLQEPFN